jgi:metallophosphoesterase (TIGR00282 family)
MFRVLAIGDIMGRPGRNLIKDSLREIVKGRGIDLVIANGENASGGAGLAVKNAAELFDSGIDVITSGNHIWDQRGYEETFDEFPRVLRPANYPEPCPGMGHVILTKSGKKAAVINLQGRVFMDAIECPFAAFDRIYEEIRDSTKIILLDFHAEATSEKMAMGWHVDGRASSCFGTHTHIPTADARILPGGTGYITDLGMCGSFDSVIGMKREAILRKFISQRPHRFEVARNDVALHGAICNIDPATGSATAIERIEFHPG